MITVKKKKIVKMTAVLLAALLFCSVMLSGCSWLLNIFVSGIQFKDKADWTMVLGTEKELTAAEVEVTPSYATEKGFTISSDNSSIVSVNLATNNIIASGVGSTNITVKSVEGGFTASKKVTVNYASVQNISILYNAQNYTVAANRIAMPTTNIEPLILTAQLGENTDPQSQINWTVKKDDVSLDEASGKDYSFTPLSVGVYAITVFAGNNQQHSDTLYLNVYAPITDGAITLKSGVLQQEDGQYSQVSFDVNFTNPVGNPDAIVEWQVNGKGAALNNTGFTFKPTVAGTYKIEVLINGIVAGEQTIFAKGSIVPSNVTIDYDNSYPKVIIRWDEIPVNVGYSISIINNVTGQEVAANINTNNQALINGKKFTSSSFDATDYLSTSSVNIFSTVFTVKVKTLGDGQALTESVWSKSATSKLVPIAAKPFLAASYMGGNKNYYITSNEEFYDFFTSSMYWRNAGSKEYGASADNYELLYMAYTYGTIKDLLDKAFSFSHITGLYAYLGNAQQNLKTGERLSANQLSVRIVFYSDGVPSKRTTDNSPNGWNALRPHVNFDDSKARPNSYVFPIDNLNKVKVTTGDQLFAVAERGFLPVPEVGSAAEKLFTFARRVLLNIITDDMTTEQKAHAIYDWILWRVTYDHKVLDVEGTIDKNIDSGDEPQKSADIREAVKYESYYLESVFTNTDYYAVCDAMSKAYSLMCNMEGIPCLRISGTVPGGGHAWNKVKLEDGWYIVDCTWGDLTTSIAGKTRESASHAYFLLTDAEVKSDHFEDVNYNYPRTSTKSYNWYDEEIAYKNDTVDFYIDGTENVEAELKMLSAYMLETVQGKQRYYAVGPDKSVEGNLVDGKYYGFDIRIKEEISANFRYSANPLVSVLSTYFQKQLNVHYLYSYEYDGNDEMYLFIFFDLSVLNV